MFVQNQKGLTLLEVLLSILILSIVLVSFFQFFPQMGLMNKENENKAIAINLAKKELIEWKKKANTFKLFLDNPSADLFPEYDHEDSNYFYFNTTKNDYNINIKIKKVSDITTNPSKAHVIIIEVLNQKNAVIGETFGYLIFE